MGILEGFKSIILVLWEFLKIPLFLCAVLVVFFIILYLIHLIILKAQGVTNPNPDGEHNKIKRRNIFLRLFVDAPRQLAYDNITRDPEFFRPQGLVAVVGRQGAGKTISAVWTCEMLKKEYPKCKVMSNIAYTNQDAKMTDWKSILKYKNGTKGVIILNDEIQNWFSSLDSKNFPPEMLEAVCQNRKNRRLWLGTAQRFNRIAKPIREQVSEIWYCYTFFGCVTFIRKVRPEMDENAMPIKKESKTIKWEMFVHNNELRNCYNTYEVVERLGKVGGKSDSDMAALRDGSAINIENVLTKKNLKSVK